MSPKRRSRKGGDATRAAEAAEKVQTTEGRAGPAEEAAATIAGELQNRLQGLQTEFEESVLAWREKEDSLLRQLAEKDNQLRRVRRNSEQEIEHHRGRLIEPLIAVLDDFDRALAHAPEDAEAAFVDGVRQVADRLREALGALGLAPIEALGAKFDPALHEALMQVPSEDVDKGLVVQEIQKGYTLGDRVLRPSKVAVSA